MRASWCHPTPEPASQVCYPFRIVTLAILTLPPLGETWSILDTAPALQTVLKPSPPLWPCRYPRCSHRSYYPLHPDQSFPVLS